MNMLKRILKENACEELMNEVKLCGYSSSEIAKKVYTEFDVIEEFESGDFRKMTFDLFVNLCHLAHINFLSLIDENSSIKDLKRAVNIY